MSVKITKAAWEEIVYAVNFPAKCDHKKLSAAIELALEQVCNQLLVKAARSHDQMIVSLNRFLKRANLNNETINLANSTLQLLEYFEVVEDLSYDEDTDNFEEFANNTLKEFLTNIGHAS
jgi:L-rhamnose mutarotase